MKICHNRVKQYLRRNCLWRSW